MELVMVLGFFILCMLNNLKKTQLFVTNPLFGYAMQTNVESVASWIN